MDRRTLILGADNAKSRLSCPVRQQGGSHSSEAILDRRHRDYRSRAGRLLDSNCLACVSLVERYIERPDGAANRRLNLPVFGVVYAIIAIGASRRDDPKSLDRQRQLFR
mgnify:FL=1